MTDARELRARLQEARRASGTSSYARGLPRAAAIPELGALLKAVREALEARPDEAELWRIRSEVEEVLLRWGSAVTSLERALALSGERDRKEVKRLARLRAEAGVAAGHGLDPRQLRALRDHLEARECGGDGAPLTRAWCEAEGVADPDRVVNGLMQLGGLPGPPYDRGVLFALEGLLRDRR